MKKHFITVAIVQSEKGDIVQVQMLIPAKALLVAAKLFFRVAISILIGATALYTNTDFDVMIATLEKVGEVLAVVWKVFGMFLR